MCAACTGSACRGDVAIGVRSTLYFLAGLAPGADAQRRRGRGLPSALIRWTLPRADPGGCCWQGAPPAFTAAQTDVSCNALELARFSFTPASRSLGWQSGRLVTKRS